MAGGHLMASEVAELMPKEIAAEWERVWVSLNRSLAEHKSKQEAILSRCFLEHHAHRASDFENGSRRSDHTQEHRISEKVQVPPSPKAAMGSSTALGKGYNREGSSASCIEELQPVLFNPERNRSELQADISDMIEHLEEKALLYPDSFRKSFSSRAQVRILKDIQWLLDKKEPLRTGRLARFIRTSAWNWVVNLTIMVNAFFMVYTVDKSVEDLDSGDPLPAVAQVIDMYFLVFFFFEVMFRLSVHKLYFFINEEWRWNVFDFLLVVLSVYDATITQVTKNSTDNNANLLFLRSVRVLRLARTMRVIRVLRFAGQLRRMMQSLLGSCMSLFWSLVMLAFVFYVFGIALVQSVTASLSSEGAPSWDDPAREELLWYFGSVSRAMLTYFMATTGGNDWALFFDLLYEMAPFAAGLFLFVVAFTQIALWNILTGMFVENAMKVATPDNEQRALEQRKADLKDSRALRSFLEELDVDCSGTITWEEFNKLSTDPRALSMFSVMGLDIKDAQLFFDMVRTSKGVKEVQFDFLVDACMKMKGPATSVDVQTLLYRTQNLSESIERQFHKLAGVTSRSHSQAQAQAHVPLRAKEQAPGHEELCTI